MGYRIVYGSPEKKKLSTKRILMILCSVAVAALMLLPAGRRALRELIIPGDAEVTASAVQTLVSDLGEGENLGDAVTAFCREVLAGGQ